MNPPVNKQHYSALKWLTERQKESQTERLSQS